jgi:carboxymethylenebutenolidase
MGGGFALLAATRGFDVSAPNYGVIPRNAAEVLRGACPIVGSYGGRDPMLPGVGRKLDAALTDAGVEHDVKVYPRAGHSFLNRHSVGPFSIIEKIAGFAYDQPSAEDAWGRILRFFGEHLT